MKSQLSALVLAALFISPVTSAEKATKNSERIYYKCHLTLDNKHDVVHGFVSVGKTQSEFEKGLAGRIVFGSDGVTGANIVKVYECVRAKQAFAAKEARQLEAKTPF